MQLQDMNDQKHVCISMIVPVYNVEPYIKECFDSIAAQTYEGRMECIFVDDCGQDDSMALLSECVGSYEGPIEISIVHHDRNRGLSAARNTGIDKAKGDYLFFIDSDDTIIPDCLKLLAAKVEKHPGVDLVMGNSHWEKTATLEFDKKQIPVFSDNPAWIRKSMLKRFYLPVQAWNKLVRKDLIKNERIYFEGGVVHEDDLWNFFLARHVRSIAFENVMTYFYRDNSNGIIAKENKDLRYEPVLKIMIQNISEPYFFYELMYVLLCAESQQYEKVFTPLFHKYKCVRELFNARIRTFDHSVFTLKGFYFQLVYRMWIMICFVANWRSMRK